MNSGEKAAGRMQASIRFLDACNGKPRFHGRQQHLDNLPLRSVMVPISDARLAPEPPSLEREGFVLADWTKDIPDLFSAAGRARYLREVEALVLALTGASKAVAFANGVVRRSERSSRHRADGTTVPGRFAHGDFSVNAAGSRYWVEKLLPAPEARERLQRRFAFYNVWHVLSDPPQDVPLALCDGRSAAADDCVPCDQVLDPPDGPEQRIENSLFRHSPGQRWHYFPNMTRREILIFKGYDADPARTPGIAHAAFDDPSCPAGAPARESIDERVMAFF